MSGTSAPSRKGLSKIACNRLQKELAEWQVNPPSGFNHKVTDNLQRWVIEVNGVPGTLYSNETFQLQVDFPEHYPMEAPQGHGGDTAGTPVSTKSGHACPNLDIKSKEQKRRVKEKSKGQDTSLVFDPVELPVDLHSVDHRKSLSLSRLSTSIHDLDLNLDSPRLACRPPSPCRNFANRVLAQLLVRHCHMLFAFVRNFILSPVQTTGENLQEAVFTNESPVSSVENISFPSPLTSKSTSTSTSSMPTMQRIPSMDNIVSKRNGAIANSRSSLPPHSRRTTSWIGSFSDTFNPPKMTELKPLAEVLGMPPSLFMPGDELHEVEL
ncbi:hypothetical protein TEA_006151 [Camellia sinensis var. sinensis]|uniref:UBC core domain-containing protein n=1 Tax=Camellia sinensis var. sinensis TaxID=542762 RepID=A0A4S4DGH4_CAMSN|nr:hypothetical protein TEA_006151 [Camellia sinensis var. sinensis]